MAKNRDRTKARSRKVNNRQPRKTLTESDLLIFSFKYLLQDQPATHPETVEMWQEFKLLPKLFARLKELSTLTRDEAVNQQQIKIYGDFPPKNKTEFVKPEHIDQHVAWAVIEGIGGKPRVAGYIVENTFYVVFLDSKHRFWISEKKHT